MALALLWSAPLAAQEGADKVIHVRLDAAHRWALGDELCLRRETRELGCGTVFEERADEVRLRLAGSPDNGLAAGDKLKVFRRGDDSSQWASYQVDRTGATVTRENPYPESARAAWSEPKSLTVVSQVSFDSINSVDKLTSGKGQFGKLTEGVEARWSPVRVRGFSTSLFLGLSHTDLSPPADRSFSTSSLVLLSAGIELGFRPDAAPRLSFQLTGAYEQLALLRAETLSVLTLDRIDVPMIRAGVRYELLRGRVVDLTLGASAAYFFSGSSGRHVVNEGEEYLGRLVAGWALGRSRLETGLAGGYQTFDTNFESLNATTIRLEIGIALDTP